MPIPSQVADELLAKCGRHCCVCRRFLPTMLQLHHIVPESKGGASDADNLIPICLTCHSDVHTDRPFTRRFTDEELKQHRDIVFSLVESGKLVAPTIGNEFFAKYQGIEIGDFARQSGLPSFPSEAIDVLVAASKSKHGRVMATLSSSGFTVNTDGFIVVDSLDPRDEARYRHGIEMLVDQGLLDEDHEIFRITDNGYKLADQFLALRARNTYE